MPRFQARLHPVKSYKHVVDVATATVLAVQSLVPVITATDNPALAAVTAVETASTVSSIYVRAEVFATNAFAGIPRVYMAVYKNAADRLGFPGIADVGDDERKRFIFHQEMTMVGNGADGTFPRTMFQGVIKIPPRFKRFGQDDVLYLIFSHGAGETSGITNVCIQCIYKEFR